VASSGCEGKVKYLPCPTFEKKTFEPVLDLNNTGVMKRLSKTIWRVTHKQVLAVKKFEKECKEVYADHISTIDAVNTYNINLDPEHIVNID
jgi:hypothetical protein